MVRHVRLTSHWQSRLLIAVATLALTAGAVGRLRAHALAGSPIAEAPRGSPVRLVSGQPSDEDGPSTQDVVRFLEQATWGPTPALIEHVKQVGFEAFLDEQFNAPMSSYPTLPPVLTTRDNTACPSWIDVSA